MSDPEINFPAIPDVGDALVRKKRLVEKITTIVKCEECKEKYSRLFKPGDYIFKKVPEEECEKCHKLQSLTIIEIYSEWIDPKKKK
jgi:hypothetical protein